MLDRPTPMAGTDANPRPNLQFYTCFDDREESIRRYIEDQAYSPNELETFGVAGFFNMAVRYKPPNQFPEEIYAPEGNQPPLNHKLIDRQLNPGFDARQKVKAELSLTFEKASYSPVGSLAIAGALL